MLLFLKQICHIININRLNANDQKIEQSAIKRDPESKEEPISYTTKMSYVVHLFHFSIPPPYTIKGVESITHFHAIKISYLCNYAVV